MNSIRINRFLKVVYSPMICLIACSILGLSQASPAADSQSLSLLSGQSASKLVASAEDHTIENAWDPSSFSPEALDEELWVDDGAESPELGAPESPYFNPFIN